MGSYKVVITVPENEADKLDSENVKAVVDAILETHTYEQPAIDVYELTEL